MEQNRLTSPVTSIVFSPVMGVTALALLHTIPAGWGRGHGDMNKSTMLLLM